MDISLSSAEVATVLRALKLYEERGDDDGYRFCAQDLYNVMRDRWNDIRPNDSEVIPECVR